MRTDPHPKIAYPAARPILSPRLEEGTDRDPLCYFSRVVIINYHKLSGLKQKIIYSFTVVELEI
jgi:hypothetical protein